MLGDPTAGNYYWYSDMFTKPTPCYLEKTSYHYRIYLCIPGSSVMSLDINERINRCSKFEPLKYEVEHD